ncbi:MAG TPA: PEP-CTERM sorting domain-containing protein, partial [Cyanobacteria bacterium UBA11162]|nr:PEP-CTERM sorting domain-containing protein [Cyanobacteria bacterium UBA11162]
MKNLLNKISATVTASAVLAMALALETANPAQAIEFNFSWKGDAGYSALGTFNYDETTAPLIISESGIGPTDYLDSLSVSFFDPSNTLLGTYNTVTGGVSNSPFFAFNFDTSTKSLFGNLDVAGGGLVKGEYFLQGTIGSSLEFRQDIDQVSQSRLVDQNSGAITVTQVPEPASVLGL